MLMKSLAIYLLILIGFLSSCKKDESIAEDRKEKLCRTWEVKYGVNQGKRITINSNGTGTYVDGDKMYTAGAGTKKDTIVGGEMTWHFTEHQYGFVIIINHSGKVITQNITKLDESTLNFFQDPTDYFFEMKAVN